jgi:hypothetical protein
MNVDQTVRAYAWLKVVPVGRDDPKQMLDDCCDQVRHNRIQTKSDDGQQLPFFMGIGMVSVAESLRHVQAAPMTLCVHPMPLNCTLEQATSWISTREGIGWRDGAASWVLVYAYATISTI